VKEKPAVGSQFFGALSSDRIHMARKDVNVRLFIHSFTFRDELRITQENSGNFLKLLLFYIISDHSVNSDCRSESPHNFLPFKILKTPSFSVSYYTSYRL